MQDALTNSLQVDTFPPCIGHADRCLMHEIECHHHAAALGLHLTRFMRDDPLEHRDTLIADFLHRSFYIYTLVRADLSDIGVCGTGGYDPLLASDVAPSNDFGEEGAFPKVEIMLLIDVVHMAENIDVGKTYLYISLNFFHGYSLMIFISPPAPTLMIEDGAWVGFPSHDALTTKSTPDFISFVIS